MDAPKVGQWAEIRQGAGEGEWLPFLITHVIDGDTVSGVAFSGHPFRVGWSRPVGDFANVRHGSDNRCWRCVGEVEAQPEPDDLTAIRGLGKKSAEWLAANGVDSFAQLAGVSASDAETMLAGDNVPAGVDLEKFQQWQSDASGRSV